MDASLLWERHPFLYAVKVTEGNLQKKIQKNAAFCSKMIDFA